MNESIKKLLSGLNPRQQEAVQSLEGPLLVLAGAGSGKTRVIVHRIANLIHHGIRPWNILAVTFTNKAAGEMRARVDRLVGGGGRGVWVSTFHSFCAQFLRVEAERIGLDSNYVVYDDADQLSIIKSILKDMMISDKECPPRQILHAISRAKDDLLDAGSYAIHAQTQGDPFRERVARIYEAYQKELKTANALDFGDLIMKTVEALRDQLPLREKYQKRFQFIMVDEYQDTNHAQYLLVKYIAGNRKNVCVVGDDDQSIYSWRGANIRNILEFERDYQGAKSVTLDQNYRSTKKILDMAGTLIAHNEKRKSKKLWTDNDAGDDVNFTEMMNEQEEARFVIEEINYLMRNQKDVALERPSPGPRSSSSAYAEDDDVRGCDALGQDDAMDRDPSKSHPGEGPPSRIRPLADRGPVSYVDKDPGSRIEALRDDGSYDDIAIFYRTNAQSRILETALRSKNIPYKIVGALRFYERAEIKDALSYLRLAVNPKDNLSLKRVINLPARGFGKNSLGLLEQYAASQGISLVEALDRIHAISGVSNAARNGARTFLGLIQQFQKYAKQNKASTSVRKILEESGYWDHWADKVETDPDAGERLDNLQELINAAKDFEEKSDEEEKDVALEGRNPGPRSRSWVETSQDDDISVRQDDEFSVRQDDDFSVRQNDEEKRLPRFLQDVSLMTDLDSYNDKGGSITLMTIHLAKGLEFPAVFVTGLEEGLFPIGDSAFDQDELEEERRLAYVAMTRAKKKLYLTCASSRRIFGTPRMNIPSRFIEEAGIASSPNVREPSSPNASVGDPELDSRQGHAGMTDEYSQVDPTADDDFNQDVDHPEQPPVQKTVVKPTFRVGQVVTHPDFGKGKITHKEGTGAQAKVTVQFFNGLQKKLLLKYAPLK